MIDNVFQFDLSLNSDDQTKQRTRTCYISCFFCVCVRVFVVIAAIHLAFFGVKMIIKKVVNLYDTLFFSTYLIIHVDRAVIFFF